MVEECLLQNRTCDIVNGIYVCLGLYKYINIYL